MSLHAPRLLPAILALATSVTASASLRDLRVERRPSLEEAACAPGEILVGFREGADALDRSRALALARATPRVPMGVGLTKSAMPAGALLARVDMDPRDAAARLAEDPAVAYAEPNWLIWRAAVPTEASYATGLLWGVLGDDLPSAVGPAGTTNPAGTQVEKAWSAGYVGNGSVLVGILDDGVATQHPDLVGNVWLNPFDVADGLDNDRNGFADDRQGWDFVNGDYGVYDGGVAGSQDSHGTHVAGIIGARANGQGSVGMCWSIGMVPVKVIGPSTGTVADAVRGIDYLIDLKSRHRLNLVAINCSWTTSAYSQALNDAAIRAARAGILLVCAAGNEGRDNDGVPSYPGSFDTRFGTSTSPAAGFDAVITVSALDPSGALASYSNRGAASVDLAAPGTGILSTIPPAGWATWSGTSCAAPHVTGALALFAVTNPGMTSPQLRDAVLGGVAPAAGLSGRVASGGRVDAWRMLASRVHDVAVTSVVAPGTAATGAVVPVSVTVRNEGGATETFSVSLQDVAPAGGRTGVTSPPVSVTLTAGASRSVSLTWNTSLATAGTHLLRGVASAVSGELDAADNVRATATTISAPATLSVTSVTPSQVRGGVPTRVSVVGSGFVAGSTVSFGNGTGAAPAASAITVAADGRSLAMTVSAPATAFAGAPWDVTVRHPDGRLARKPQSLTIIP